MIPSSLVALNVNFKFMILKFIFTRISPYAPDSRIVLLFNITTGVSNHSSNLTHPKLNLGSPLLPCLLLPQSPENGHSILPGAQAKSLGVTLDSFSHSLIQFIGKSCWLYLKNTSRIQIMAHSFLWPLWSNHLSPGLRCSCLTVLLPCALYTPLQCIFNTTARDPFKPQSYHVIPLPQTLHWLHITE